MRLGYLLLIRSHRCHWRSRVCRCQHPSITPIPSHRPTVDQITYSYRRLQTCRYRYCGIMRRKRIVASIVRHRHRFHRALVKYRSRPPPSSPLCPHPASASASAHRIQHHLHHHSTHQPHHHSIAQPVWIVVSGHSCCSSIVPVTRHPPRRAPREHRMAISHTNTSRPTHTLPHLDSHRLQLRHRVAQTVRHSTVRIVSPRPRLWPLARRVVALALAPSHHRLSTFADHHCTMISTRRSRPCRMSWIDCVRWWRCRHMQPHRQCRLWSHQRRRHRRHRPSHCHRNINSQTRMQLSRIRVRPVAPASAGILHSPPSPTLSSNPPAHIRLSLRHPPHPPSHQLQPSPVSHPSPHCHRRPLQQRVCPTIVIPFVR